VLRALISRQRFLRSMGLALVMAGLPRALQAKPIKLNGWLRLETLQGKVVYRRRKQARPLKAWVGQKLWRVGEILETGPRASATLALDLGLGTLVIAPSTQLLIKTLHTNAAGGRVTQLELLQGQARLKVRPMSNSESRLEIHTPAGITGVRGTDFGVAVQGDGQTGVATLTGLVEASAQGKAVGVGQQFQALVVPRQQPQDPEPLRDDPGLDMSFAKQVDGVLRLVGVTDPLNLLLVNETPFSTGPKGEFEVLLPIGEQKTVTLHVITPLGKQRKYEIPLA